MKSELNFTKKEAVVLLGCLAFVLMNIAAIGSSGRRRAKEAVCLSNLRQWGAIFEMFTKNNDGYFYSGQYPIGYWWVADLEGQYQSYKQNKLWFCPEAKKPLIDEDGNSAAMSTIFNAWGIYTQSFYPGFCSDGVAGSYGLNGYALNVPPGTSFEGGRNTSDNWRTPNVEGAANVPLFIDALRFDLWPLDTESPSVHEPGVWTGNHMARCCINRHNGAVGCLFMDSSARKVGLKELWTLKWHRTYNTEGPWTIAGGVQPNEWPDWMRQFKDY